MKRTIRAISPPGLLPPEKLRKIVERLAPTGKSSAQLEAASHKSDGTSHDDDKSDSVKIMSWNCDGLLQYLSTTTTAMDAFVKKAPAKLSEKSFLHKLLARHNPDVMCLQEVHLWSSDMKQVTKQLQQDAPGYSFHSCLPLGKGGRRKAGVLTLYKEKYKGLATTDTVDWDQEGRVSILRFPRLHIYNVYCLNSSENPYKDPVTGETHGTRSERKRLFDAKLASTLQAHVDQGVQVVLLGDLNISRYKIDSLGGHLRTHHPHDLNRAHFNDKFSPFRDIIRERFPDRPKYTWFSRAEDSWTGNNDKARVDLILLSHGLSVNDADT
ncbi:Predicted protein [Taphrina deformans PYCC 5710]|uniref:Endonuclease/exonuclease/phosphatase domain-containing protein n=1 Tax=Taphrina deformans (strain PYCC 5710 / ATCC 11124 / CBS 356.35 / IMI 108563 / JCM 9778 / NBRC 8474) TaxID=1097556 RepID=R4X6C7_TAPDE|nr:Predicted protein [Taphrina deformans PYCC 5710]|eukprot:CCG80575.1 Predicted protein [Taphrina deformans PYCC 5710]